MSRVCTSCKQRVLWARTLSGERFALDPLPDPSGSFVIEMVDGHPLARMLDPKALRESGLERYKGHFAACREARLRV